MDAATFADALNTVEQDHQLVLDRMQALSEMVAALAAPERGLKRLLRGRVPRCALR